MGLKIQEGVERRLFTQYMFEYLLSTSYSGYEYWKHNGVDFKGYFKTIKALVNDGDFLPTYEFENILSKILKQIPILWA